LGQIVDHQDYPSPAEELSARLDRAFWDNGNLPDTLSSSLGQLPRTVTMAKLMTSQRDSI
jgi:hypothetical protein